MRRINKEIEYIVGIVIFSDLVKTTRSEELQPKHMKTLFKLFNYHQVSEEQIKESQLLAGIIICAKAVMDVIEKCNKNGKKI